MPVVARFRRPTLVTLRPECIEIGGDLVVGALLSQIAYWHMPDKFGKSKLRISRAGLYWIAKTRIEWMEETGLTLDQYRRAIAVLKEKGLVEVRVMRFQGDAISHLRLRMALFAELCESISLNRLRDNPPTGTGKIPHPSTESTYRDYRHHICTRTCADGEETYEREKRGKKRHERTERTETQHTSGAVALSEVTTMNAKEILQRHRAQREANPPTTSVPDMWQRRCATIYGGARHERKPLTYKEVCQLKALKKKLGTRTMEVVTYVIDHWETFATHAGNLAGVKTPTEPVPGFVLQHYTVALELLWPSPKMQEPVPTTPTTMVPTKPTEEEGPPVSQAELDAMLADLLTKP